MARELRALMYDKDSGEITRPDIPTPVGSTPGEGDLRASGLRTRQERELAPYTAMPVMPSRLNEPTVPDAALRVSMARTEVRDDHTPSDVGRKPRSGPRHQIPSPAPPPAVASTLPPPARRRSRQSLPPDGARARTSLPPDGGLPRASIPPDSSRAKRSAPPESGFGRTTAKATPVASRESERLSLFHASLLVMGTALAAAAIGVGLGNGSVERLFSPAPPVDVSNQASPVARAPLRQAPAPVVAPAPRVSPAPLVPPAPLTVRAEEAPKVPVMRIEELPPGEGSATPEPATPPTASVRSAPTPSRKARR